jgi:branched-chain amino acid transport system permease protein
MSLATPASAAPPFDGAKALRDALITTLIGLGVFGIIVGFQTGRPVDGKPFLGTRPLLLGVILGAIFIGSLLRSWMAWRKDAANYVTEKAKPKGPSILMRIEPIALPILIGMMVIFPLLALGFAGPGTQKWLNNYGIQILIYVMLGWGLNIVVGLAGLLDLGYVAFYAIGAYTYALLQTYYGVSFWFALPAAGAMAALWGVLLGFPVLRLRGDYLAIVTLAFGEIIYLVAKNWKDFTGGGSGLRVQRIDFFGIPFTPKGGFAELFGIPFSPVHRLVFLYYVIFVLAMVTLVVTIRLRKLPVGRCARMRLPAVRLASTPPTPSSPPLRSGRLSAASPAASSARIRALSIRNPSSSSRAPSSSRSWCLAAWARCSASCWRRQC